MSFIDRFRGHRPDSGTLSAYLDGQLDQRATAETEAHLAACEPCRLRLGELRETRSLLRAVPEAEPPRSFRLHEADVRPVEPRQPSSVTRWMPALSAAAVIVFAVLVGFDINANAGTNSSGSTSLSSAPAERAAADSATAMEGAQAPGPSQYSQEDGAEPTSQPPAAAHVAPDEGAAGEPTEQFQAAGTDRQPVGSGGDDGDDLALRIAEAGVAAVALGAAGASVVIWKRRRGV